MKIDSHQHFWHYMPEAYGWIGPEMAVLKRDFLPVDLAPLLGSLDFDGSVAVQARQTLEETRWLLELADQYAFIKGVVGWVDLCSPDLAAQLDQFGAHSKLCGVRHIVHDEPDDRFMLRADFLRGLKLLAGYGLTYDILIHPRHLAVACDLVELFSEQPFVLDHLAKPFIKDGELSPWESDLRRLAAFPNVLCKVSGMVTEADWQGWQPADFQPYLDVVFDAFGPQRLMIGSDWPVCTLAGAYAPVMHIVLDYVKQFSPEEQAGILGENAIQFYSLSGG
ncbi:MAG TPA: amidohydrolase family protein [Anaerolineae bacterium]